MTNLERTAAAVEPLIQWYRKNERDLPWRQRPVDPYGVWVSEIMLQQTRIEAVIPYYTRFLRELPDVASLASASEDLLMKLWEGLGYYSRVRNMKKAAVQICEEYGGSLPSKAQLLETLPGIGSYTAGAIASIAFGEGVPAVDGNVLRVLSRLWADHEDITLEKNKKRARELLREVYPLGEDAGCLSQGLMELGEVVCIPNGVPLCDRCPLYDLCLARQKGLVEILPVKREKKERRIEHRLVLLLEQNSRFALQRREKTGLLASMLEFPSVEAGVDLNSYLSRRGIQVSSIRECGDTVHVFSHVEWHMKGFWVNCHGQGDGLQWYTANEICNDVALPTAFRYFRRLLKR